MRDSSENNTKQCIGDVAAERQGDVGGCGQGLKNIDVAEDELADGAEVQI